MQKLSGEVQLCYEKLLRDLEHSRIFNKLTLVFYASDLLLIMNFVITSSKKLWIHEAIAEWIRRLL